MKIITITLRRIYRRISVPVFFSVLSLVFNTLNFLLIRSLFRFHSRTFWTWTLTRTIYHFRRKLLRRKNTLNRIENTSPVNGGDQCGMFDLKQVIGTFGFKNWKIHLLVTFQIYRPETNDLIESNRIFVFLLDTVLYLISIFYSFHALYTHLHILSNMGE